jgi:hypothetical protein
MSEQEVRTWRVQVFLAAKLPNSLYYKELWNFVRMVFREYWQEHLEWDNPFGRIKAPKKKKGKRRDVLGEAETIKLFYPGVDPVGWRTVPRSARHSLASTLEAEGSCCGTSRIPWAIPGWKQPWDTSPTPKGKINKITKKIGRVSDREAVEVKIQNNAVAFQAG